MWLVVGLCGNVIKNLIFCIQDTSDSTPQLIRLFKSLGIGDVQGVS